MEFLSAKLIRMTRGSAVMQAARPTCIGPNSVLTRESCVASSTRLGWGSAIYVAILLAMAIVFSARAAAPEITQVRPLAVVPGERTILTFSGSNLESVSNLWTLSGSARFLTNTSSKAVFELLCPAEKTGLQAIRAYGSKGATGLQLVFADPMRTGTNSAGSKLQSPIAVDGQFEPERINEYRFNAKAGEELSIEVLAHRLGSLADPVVRISTADGREVAYCDDEDGTWRDARLRFRAPASSEYTLAIHDVGYAGGAKYFYRLRIGDFPLMSCAYPLRDDSEMGTRESDAGATNCSPANPEPGVWFSELPMLMEREPNDVEAGAQEFGVPVVLNGRFQSAFDRDLFRFKVSTGQKLEFAAQSRALGSPCDVLLRLRKQGGSVLVENSGASESGPVFSHAFLDAGTYFLEARELTGSAPANAPYRVKVSHWRPAFRLSSEVNHLTIAGNEGAKLKITCERDGYDGPIELSAPGVVLENAIIPAEKKEVEVRIKLQQPPAQFIAFAIEGRGTNGVVREVSTRPVLKKAFPLMLYPPPDLDGRFIAVMIEK